MKFYRHCEHCGKEIVHEWNGRESYGQYKPLCDECEAAHEIAQGHFCPGCGVPVDGEGERCLRCVGQKFDTSVAQGSIRRKL
jgi:predicted amidophosphoribosyltransferase